MASSLLATSLCLLLLLACSAVAAADHHNLIGNTAVHHNATTTRKLLQASQQPKIVWQMNIVIMNHDQSPAIVFKMSDAMKKVYKMNNTPLKDRVPNIISKLLNTLMMIDEPEFAFQIKSGQPVIECRSKQKGDDNRLRYHPVFLYRGGRIEIVRSVEQSRPAPQVLASHATAPLQRQAAVAAAAPKSQRPSRTSMRAARAPAGCNSNPPPPGLLC